MATTTNYGWTTPDDTALVKDGAAAIRTLGTSVDTTTKNLNPSTTLGDIEYRSSTANTNTRLGIGTSGQVLTVSGGVPAWATSSSGGMTLISETTASALSSLSFSSLGSYKQLLLIWAGVRHSATGSAFSIRFNNDSSSIYSINGFQATDSTYNLNASNYTNIEGGNTFSIYAFGQNTTLTAVGTDVFGSLLVDNYTSTTKSKYWEIKNGYYNNNSGYGSLNLAGLFNSTSAITSLDIVRLSGSATFSNQNNTTIRLYGVS
jgi:hypothetical protein